MSTPDDYETEYDRLKAQKDAILAKREMPTMTALEDTFNGNDAHLLESVKALLALDASNALIPHGIGGHARALLSSLSVRLATLRAVAEWRSMETAPKDGTVIDLWIVPNEEMQALRFVPGRAPNCRWVKHCQGAGWSSVEPSFTPTHWMPLPPAPGQRPLAPAPAPEGRGETAETPETEMAWATLLPPLGGSWRPVAKGMKVFASRLERQRDEARAERDAERAKNAEAEEFTAVRADIVRLSKKVAQYRADFENANYRNEEMRRERDAAVAQAQALREAVEKAMGLLQLSASPFDEACVELRKAAALAASEAGK